MKSLESIDEIVNKKLLSTENSQNIKLKFSNEKLFESDENFKNKFYFENLTDESFFDICGAKDDFVLFYKKIIQSGVACIILGGVRVGISEKKIKNHARISLNKNVLSKYKQIALLAHSSKTKVFLKINACHGRYKNYHKYEGLLNIGSNYCLKPNNRQKIVFRISDGKCNELVNEIYTTTMISSISGLDGIMLDASFSNIIGELSSQEFNKRVFGYYSNTNDFLKRTLKIIGKENFIILKFSLISLFCWSNKTADLCLRNRNISIKKIIEDLKSYIDLGVDGFEFVFGVEENEFLINFNQFEPDLLFEEFVEEFRDYLNDNKIKNKKGNDILIFYHDNFSDFEKTENLIKRKIVNFIDVTKNIYSDLNFINSTKNAKHIQNCLKCSHCNMIFDKKQNIECLINPNLVDFEDIKINKQKEKVSIIGSGISGLICTLTLAQRGFCVDIYEQLKEINHYGKLSTIFGFDKLLSDYFYQIENKVLELSKKKIINIFLNQKFIVNKDNLNQYNSIVVATGFKSKFLAISGAVQSHVVNIFDCLEDNNKLLSKKKIVIYAKTELSLKLALYLVENKKSVTIIIKDTNLFIDEKNANMSYYFFKLYSKNVKIHFDARLTKINEDNIDVMICKNLNPTSIDTMLKLFSNTRIKSEYQLFNIDCDYLIYEPDISPNNSLYIDIVNKKYRGEVYLIGDALESSNLAETIKSGYFVGKNI